jgi:uncharacterized protein
VAGEPATMAMIEAAHGASLPNRVLAIGDPAGANPAASPLLADRPMVSGQATAYVCRQRTCLPPMTDPGALQALLADGLVGAA